MRADSRSGALALAQRAAEAIVLLAAGAAGRSLPRFRRELAATCKRLIAAQPTMAPVVQLANAVLWAGDAAGNTAEAVERVGEACEGFRQQVERAGAQVASHAVGLIADGSAVLTHSASDTVLRALLLARARNKRFRVICTESRPVSEGRTMAAKLAAARIPVTLIIDAAAAIHLERARIVLVGADAISLGGLINKAGTALLAAAASRFGKPMYALCDSTKLVPPGYRLSAEAPKDPREILGQSLSGVSVSNLYFDVTPLDWLKGVVTEEGVSTPAQIRRRLRRLRCHESLRPVRPRDSNRLN